MKKTYIWFYVLLITGFLLLLTPVTAQQPSSTSSSSVTTSAEITRLQDQVERLRDENYQQAIKRADDAGIKADRFTTMMAALATVFGVVIAFITFVGGSSVKGSVDQLSKFRVKAQKNAGYIEEIYLSAQKKQDSMDKRIAALDKTEEELSARLKSKKESSVSELAELKKTIESIKEDAKSVQGTVSELQTLRDSASFASGATGPSGPNYSAYEPFDFGTSATTTTTVPSATTYATSSGTTTGTTTYTAMGNPTRCANCNKPLSSLLSHLPIRGRYFCHDCEQLGHK